MFASNLLLPLIPSLPDLIIHWQALISFCKFHFQ